MCINQKEAYNSTEQLTLIIDNQSRHKQYYISKITTWILVTNLLPFTERNVYSVKEFPPFIQNM